MGAATARALAAQGAKVAIFDLNLNLAQEVSKEINGLAFECDVSDAASAEQAIANAREIHGTARICINCAGISPAKRIVGKEGAMPLAAFEQVLDVNLLGTFNVMRVIAHARVVRKIRHDEMTTISLFLQ